MAQSGWQTPRRKPRPSKTPPALQFGIATGNVPLRIVTEPEPGSDYGFAVLKGQNAELLSIFNAGLKNAKDSGVYQQIVDRYLSIDDDSASADNSFWSAAADLDRAAVTGSRADTARHHAGDPVCHDPRHPVRHPEAVGQPVPARTGGCLRQHLPRHPGVGAGVLLLLRCASRHRPAAGCADSGRHHAVVERRRLHHRDRSRRRAIGRPGSDGGLALARHELGRFNAPRCDAAGVQDHDAEPHQPVHHHSEGHLAAVGPRLR